MNGIETGRFDDEHSGDPKLERMNNFYSYLPGQLYRPEPEGDGINYVMYQLLEKHKKWFDKPREAWPKEEAGDIGASKVRFEVQAEIDEILEQNPKLAGWWEDWKNKYPDEMTDTARRAIENQVIRPVYVMLREKFSQEQLTT